MQHLEGGMVGHTYMEHHQPLIPSLEAVVPLQQALDLLQTQAFTGIAQVATNLPETNRHLAYDLSVYRGSLTMVDKRMPSPEDLMRLLGKMLKLAVMDSLLQYVEHRATNYSHRAVLEAVVNTRFLSWESIEKAVTERLVLILERFQPHTCTVRLYPNPEWDLCYGELPHGIDSRLILERIEARKALWQQLQPTIPSFEAIPRLQEGVLATVHHKPTRHHLETWVNGENTIADIAESVGKDSLSLASLYLRWAKEGLISFVTTDPRALSTPVVLTVDDSPIVQALIRRTLGDRYEVISATSAIDALSLLNHHDVSLILLDVTMPEMDGFEFCRTIRKIERFKDIPVIMLTAKEGLIDRAKGHLAGANCYLTKPVNPDLLLSTIEKFI